MANETASTNKWTKRDVLTFVAFNLIIIAVTTVLKMAEDMLLSPQNTFFVGSWLFPLAATPFYMVMADRIGKRGVLFGTTVVFGIIYTFMGGIYCLPIGIVGGIIGELVMWGEGSYHNPVRLIAGFFVYWVTFGCYGIFPYLFFRESYTEMLQMYYSIEDINAMVAQYTEPQWIALMIAMFAVGTIVGGLIGSRLLNKHVRKAKIA